MPFYDKDQLKGQLELEQIYDLLTEWGGEPEYIDSGLLAQTICHNPAHEGSRKLYYYENSKLFHCYSGCEDPSFDIFQLACKVAKNQLNQNWELYDAMHYIASYFGIAGVEQKRETEQLQDWEIFSRYDKIIDINTKNNIYTPKIYDKSILKLFAYPHIGDWERQGISAEVNKANLIGYYPGGEQITIPHFDINDNLIGIRGRTLSKEDAERYGKYRPLYVSGKQYNHPLSINLYGLNKSKEAIKAAETAIVFEGEKSVLLSQTYYGDSSIAVAACGSNLSSQQVYLLQSLGVKNIIIAFDRQYESLNTEESKKWIKKLTSIYNKYHNYINLSFIFDKENVLGYKDSPIDCSKENFEYLLKRRIYL